jgi:mono/diheme cytochrome c family protein
VGPIDAGGGDTFDFGDGGPEADAGPVFPTFNRSVAWRMIPSPGGAIIVHQRSQASAVTLLGSTCGNFGGYGAASDFEFGTVHATFDLVADGGVSTAAAAGFEHDLVLPVDVALSASGRVAMVGAGNSALDVFPLDDPFAGTRVPTLTGRPTAVAFRGEDTVVFIREPAELNIIAADGTFTRIELGGASVASTGWDIFHTATPSLIACASCHPEAGDDAHVWQLPDGLRRTPSLRGGLSGTAPFHWSGNELDMGALLDDVLVSRMSGPKESAPRQQALLDWLDGQGVLPAPPSDATKVALGQATFNARCASCHAGAQGTNNTTVDVGTGGAFQVPRLHELWYRAPFIHDGRAATLADRFGPAGGTNHGDTSTLSTQELDDLLAYLRSR